MQCPLCRHELIPVFNSNLNKYSAECHHCSFKTGLYESEQEVADVIRLIGAAIL